MTSLLTSQWLDACIIVPAEDCDIIARLAQRAAAEGYAVLDLAGLRKYALTTPVNAAEASLVQSLTEKSRAIDAARVRASWHFCQARPNLSRIDEVRASRLAAFPTVACAAATTRASFAPN